MLWYDTLGITPFVMKRICITLIGLSIGVTCNIVAADEIGTASAVTMQADGALAALSPRDQEVVMTFIQSIEIVQTVAAAAAGVNGNDAGAIGIFCEKVEEMISFGKEKEGVAEGQQPSEAAAQYLVDYFEKQGVNPSDVFASLYQELTRLSQANYFGNERLQSACQRLIAEIGME